jgi:hypothetical protein
MLPVVCVEDPVKRVWLLSSAVLLLAQETTALWMIAGRHRGSLPTRSRTAVKSTLVRSSVPSPIYRGGN